MSLANSGQTLEQDLTGQTLERYRLLRKIGVGGMGTVYEAEHTHLRKRFAVKLLRYDLTRHEIARKRFLREAQAASSVTHPHVVAISDFGETPDGRVFLVMELLNGQDLHDLLETERQLPWPRAREILLQITSALQAAHMQDIVHRDVKPSNCFLADIPGKGDEDFVKVLDFGIAKLSSLTEETAHLTSTGEIFGTVAYMAPEMTQGVTNDHRSDVYAVGVMMYRMLVGELPFSAGNAFQILSQHITTPPPRPRAKHPSIPQGVEDIILRALAKNRDDRFASMQELGQALRQGSLDATETPADMPTTLPDVSFDLRAETTLDGRPPQPPEIVSGHTMISSSLYVHPRQLPTGPQPTGQAPNELISGALDTAMTPSLDGAGKRRLALRMLPILGLALLAGPIALLVSSSMGQPTPRSAPTRPEPQRAEAEPKPAPEPKTAPQTEPQPLQRPDPEPEPEAEPEIRLDPEPEPEPELGSDDALEEDPNDNMLVEPIEAPTQGRRTTKPRSKPKTDQSVASTLRLKIVAQCKQTGNTTVKLEGVISASGTIASTYVEPPTGTGACAKKLVKAARFPKGADMRPMPKLSVDL